MPEKEPDNTYISCIGSVQAVEYTEHTKYYKNWFSKQALFSIKEK